MPSAVSDTPQPHPDIGERRFGLPTRHSVTHRPAMPHLGGHDHIPPQEVHPRPVATSPRPTNFSTRRISTTGVLLPRVITVDPRLWRSPGLAPIRSRLRGSPGAARLQRGKGSGHIRRRPSPSASIGGHATRRFRPLRVLRSIRGSPARPAGKGSGGRSPPSKGARAAPSRTTRTGSRPRPCA